MNQNFDFSHNTERYLVSWDEEDKILHLTFYKYIENNNLENIGFRRVPLLGTIDEAQLKGIVTDYWNAFKKKIVK